MVDRPVSQEGSSTRPSNSWRTGCPLLEEVRAGRLAADEAETVLTTTITDLFTRKS